MPDGYRQPRGVGLAPACRDGSPTATTGFNSRQPTRHKGCVVKPSPDPRCSYRQAWTHDPRVIPALQAHITGGEEWAAAHKER